MERITGLIFAPRGNVGECSIEVDGAEDFQSGIQFGIHTVRVRVCREERLWRIVITLDGDRIFSGTADDGRI